jgi:hypothetical protein
MPKTTFKELGLTFDFDEHCISCTDGSCHTVIQSSKDGQDYSVHISTDREGSFFDVYASTSSSTFSESEINESFQIEEGAVKFICENFGDFKCF